MGECETRIMKELEGKRVVIIMNNGYQMSGKILEQDEGIIVFVEESKDSKMGETGVKKVIFKVNVSTIYAK